MIKFAVLSYGIFNKYFQILKIINERIKRCFCKKGERSIHIMKILLEVNDVYDGK